MQNWIRRAASAVAWRIRCQWATLTAGHLSKAALTTRPLRKLLVICYGNIYRSPYAAVLLGDRLGAEWQVRSAGLHRVPGRQSPPAHVERSLQSGVDLRSHRSATISAVDLQWADAIVLMDRHNWQALRQLGADPRRLIWLGVLDGGAEIRDPYGLRPAEAERIMQRVHRATEALAAAILARHPSSAG